MQLLQICLNCGGVININESQNIFDSTTLESKSQPNIKLVCQASHPVCFDTVGERRCFTLFN